VNFAVVHRADAGHERRKGAEQWQETRNDQGLAAVLLVEGVRAVRAPMRLKKRELFPVEDLRPEIAADLVVEHVAKHRCDHQHGEQEADLHAAQRCQRTGHEQQRIAGQERRHHEAGFAEDDHEQDRIDPLARIAVPASPDACRDAG
jgi:hypothetical protein